MSAPLLQHEVEIEIPFHDCDPAGIVWHGNYARYFEVARCALLETLNYNYDHMAESGYAWPLIDFQARFVRPLRFKQKVRVRARIVEWEYRLKIDYLMTDSVSGERLTKGFTTQVAVDIANGEMNLASPEILLKKLGVGQ
ncbi:acyl-CoA thioesterase [Stenotrophobium rhamnosiphilum]|uniref:4-hydroxybenzoyl-CoA thioesterase n=1 Tax=Stenotrophobium rhamnosiphilum TaxID=2029166 RepID=A0A2T5MFR5_9GAMM|nr:acyl-CoA thioesterase [Stenotrophobium rhamnosiphilum]PTU31400.1 4-hydroxybenzoyl-CoA thioesterase [Stenotrophobium rhamnosiphilum]